MYNQAKKNKSRFSFYIYRKLLCAWRLKIGFHNYSGKLEIVKKKNNLARSFSVRRKTWKEMWGKSHGDCFRSLYGRCVLWWTWESLSRDCTDIKVNNCCSLFLMHSPQFYSHVNQGTREKDRVMMYGQVTPWHKIRIELELMSVFATPKAFPGCQSTHRKTKNQPNLLCVQKAASLISEESLALFLSSSVTKQLIPSSVFFLDSVILKRICGFVQSIGFSEYNSWLSVLLHLQLKDGQKCLVFFRLSDKRCSFDWVKNCEGR